MRLAELLNGLVVVNYDMDISGLALDSRKVVSANIFIALSGSRQHGLVHVQQAIENGACTVIYDPEGGGRELALSIESVPVIEIDNLDKILGQIAARFYGDPSMFMDVIGITGTNGKTTCSHFLAQLLTDCAIIGTLGWGEYGKLNDTVNTTPDALEIQRILSELLKSRRQTVAMEVSSHGMAQGRVEGVHFKGAVFTNISRDHLDYHLTMEDYLNAKLKLLNNKDLDFVVVNSDDSQSEKIIAASHSSVDLWTFSCFGKVLNSEKSIIASNILYKIDGIEFEVSWLNETQRISIPLYGDFNVENVLSVLTVMLAMGFSLHDSITRIAKLKPVAGRMESVGGGLNPQIFIDYAHTPDALNKVLGSLRKHCVSLEPSQNRVLWLVFGCGGDRDKGKRPEMGAIAEKWSDHIVITDDNPRFENSSNIINDILSGCVNPLNSSGSKVEVIQNRKQAIQSVISRAGKDDCILIAGKGHENYQESKGIQTPFCDKQIVYEALKMRTT